MRQPLRCISETHALTFQAGVSPSSRQPRRYTIEEVAAHNTREDVWVVLKSKVRPSSAPPKCSPARTARCETKHCGGDWLQHVSLSAHRETSAE